MLGINADLRRRIDLLEARVDLHGKVLDEMSIKNTAAHTKTQEDIRHIRESLDRFAAAFQAHDEAEMKKYDSIQKSQARFEKMFYAAIGAFMLIKMMGLDRFMGAFQ